MYSAHRLIGKKADDFQGGNITFFSLYLQKKINANFVSLYTQKVPESEIVKAFFQFKAANLFCCEDQKEPRSPIIIS